MLEIPNKISKRDGEKEDAFPCSALSPHIGNATWS